MLLHFFSRRRNEAKRNLFRNFIFGVEDSLVSTVGLLSGIAAANTSRLTIITTGIVLIFVEAFSMGIGSYLSEETSQQYSSHRKISHITVFKAALVMFISYLLAGLIPLSPYLLFTGPRAEIYSILATLSSLIILGIYTARLFRGNILSKALEMFLLGGLATLVGIVIGSLLG
ncbi:MAG: VIT1/CCC1 transporter family protein [bacterium]